MLQDFIEAEAERLGVAAIESLDHSWGSDRAEVRRRLVGALGLRPLPTRSPLNVTKLETTHLPGYRIEKLTFEPRPGFVAPALAYVPDPLDRPTAAVLFSVGHWMHRAKAEPDVQRFCANLAKLGIVTLVFDPIGQGERGASFADHGHIELTLAGLSQEGLMAWEHVRAVDYLVSRDDVDPLRIGMTGASGGGLSTIYTAAIDDRIATAVPVCYVTPFGRMIRILRGCNWNNQGDLCNQVPGIIEFAEMAGICGLISPRPVLIINGTSDPQFPYEGAKEVWSRLRSLYADELSERLAILGVQSGHGYEQPMREAAYGWMRRWLQRNGDGSAIPELNSTVFEADDPTIRCLSGTSVEPSGQLIRRLAQARIRTRGSTASATSGSEIREVLGLPYPLPAPIGHLTRSIKGTGVEEHRIGTEPGIVLRAILTEAVGRTRGYVVLIRDEGITGVRATADAGRLQAGGLGTLMVELRGTGETRPVPPAVISRATLDGAIELLAAPSGQDLEFEVWSNCLMLGRSLLGQRVVDTVAAINYLQSIRPDFKVSIMGSGAASSLTTLFAASMGVPLELVVMDRLLVSLASLVDHRDARFPLIGYVFGIVERFDIADVVGILGPLQVVIANPIGPNGQLCTSDVAQSALRLAGTRVLAEGGHLIVGEGDAIALALAHSRTREWLLADNA